MTATRATVFLLSPAYCGGRRAAILLNPASPAITSQQLRAGQLSLGAAFAFMSGLYFRGKLTYAQRFGTPLVITLRAAVENGQLVLTVENSGSWTSEPASGGVGLSNVRDRLALAYGGAASLHTEASDGMVRVRVSLPYTRISA